MVVVGSGRVGNVFAVAEGTKGGTREGDGMDEMAMMMTGTDWIWLWLWSCLELAVLRQPR